jgi:hypothetical protein
MHDKGFLAFRAKSCLAQLGQQTFLIDRFQETETHFVLHAIGTADDLFRQVFEFHSQPLLQAAIYTIPASIPFIFVIPSKVPSRLQYMSPHL